MHNQGYSTMCGHGIIALATAAVERNLFSVCDPGNIRMDTPAGTISARYHADESGQSSVTFTNVPAFVYEQALEIEVGAEKGMTSIAFGGAYYAYIDTTAWDIPVRPDRATQLIALGKAIKQAVNDELVIEHPCEEHELGYLYGVIFTSFDRDKRLARNACVFADRELDRSPTGTGVSGLAALLIDRGELGLGEPLEVESILGTRFQVCCRSETPFGDRTAVVTEVTGNAWFTGEHRFAWPDGDPLAAGFLLR
jgi:trans-L-3-hydroxyproline dehydratase